MRGSWKHSTYLFFPRLQPSILSTQLTFFSSTSFLAFGIIRSGSLRVDKRLVLGLGSGGSVKAASATKGAAIMWHLKVSFRNVWTPGVTLMHPAPSCAILAVRMGLVLVISCTNTRKKDRLVREKPYCGILGYTDGLTYFQIFFDFDYHDGMIYFII